MLGTHDLATAARLRARVELARAEIQTLDALPLQPRTRTIVAISKVDLECAMTRLQSDPDSLELEYLGRWLEMVERQLHTVRMALTAFGYREPPTARTA